MATTVSSPGCPLRSALRRIATSLALTALLAGCASGVVLRNASPEPLPLTEAWPYGIAAPGLRLWGDVLDAQDKKMITGNWAEFARTRWSQEIASGLPLVENSLVLSGGGPDGAFGAGLLNGWTARGDRPTFDMVTGVSTGAILAVFAFLGPGYDAEMTEVYTTYRTRDLLQPAIFAALSGAPALTDATGYRNLIEQYIDEPVIEQMAAAYARGRVLLIGTTNLDAARPVVWNVTAIAASGHPRARELIHDIVQASSAIPGAFPPVMIPVVTPDGAFFDEMHVDGGATQQLMLFSPDFSLRRIEQAAGLDVDRRVYVVINNKLRKRYEPVPARIVSIAGRASSSLIGGSGSGDIYKIFAVAQRDDIELEVVSIPTDFAAEATEPFDPVYMGALYDLGYEIGLAGDTWSPTPPGYLP